MASERQRSEPRADRLVLPKGYEVASGDVALLSWSDVEEWLQEAQNYWLATTYPDGRPHVTPVWGTWVDGVLYFDGIPTARWARNIAVNPLMSVHLESGSDVVILDGVGDDLETDAVVAARIHAAWDRKYGRLHPKADDDGIF